MTDIVERAKAALEGVSPDGWTYWEAGDGEWCMDEMTLKDSDFIAQAHDMVTELVTEVERLRGQ